MIIDPNIPSLHTKVTKMAGNPFNRGNPFKPGNPFDRGIIDNGLTHISYATEEERQVAEDVENALIQQSMANEYRDYPLNPKPKLPTPCCVVCAKRMSRTYKECIRHEDAEKCDYCILEGIECVIVCLPFLSAF